MDKFEIIKNEFKKICPFEINLDVETKGVMMTEKEIKKKYNVSRIALYFWRKQGLLKKYKLVQPKFGQRRFEYDETELVNLLKRKGRLS